MDNIIYDRCTVTLALTYSSTVKWKGRTGRDQIVGCTTSVSPGFREDEHVVRMRKCSTKSNLVLSGVWPILVEENGIRVLLQVSRVGDQLPQTLLESRFMANKAGMAV